MIAVIDYGAGNLRNVVKALKFLGADVTVAADAKPLADADAVVLPGVGAFDDCINSLNNQGLLRATKDFIETRKPFLGICVGYQALFERSEEFNSCAAGLQVFDGEVVKFSGKDGVKVPQIGWNQVRTDGSPCPLYKEIPDGSHFYFVHSFYPKPKDESIIASRTEYGEDFASSVWKENVYATQFHPEKSQKTGLKLLSNFLELV